MGRVLVERVEGYCTVDEWMRSYNEINQFEEQLTAGNAIVVKFWLQIRKAEQLKRFRAAAAHSVQTLQDHRRRLAQSQKVEPVRSRGVRHGRPHQHRNRPMDPGRSRRTRTTANQGAAHDRGAAPGRLEIVSTGYRAPSWLAGSHAQTIYPALFKRGDPRCAGSGWKLSTAISSISTGSTRPAAPASASPLVVLFHGLEGDSSSHYARALMRHLQAIGWRGVVRHFRGLQRRAELAAARLSFRRLRRIGWMLSAIRALEPSASLYVVGVSLGGQRIAELARTRGSARRSGGQGRGGGFRRRSI